MDAIVKASDLCEKKADSVDPVDRHTVEEARKFIEYASRSEAKYSAMVAAYLEKHPLLERSVQAAPARSSCGVELSYLLQKVVQV